VRFSQEQAEFAEAVRAFGRRECGTLAQRDAWTDGGREADSPALLAKLAGLGWLGISLPAEHGGVGGTFVDECVFLEESARAQLPVQSYGTGLTAAQTYLRYGTDAQKRTIVGSLVSGRFEAIALSEPGAGSDLGGVTCKAVADDAGWTIDGQKTWNTAGHLADHILVLTRSDSGGTKHQGLTLLMVPAGAPGLDIRPIATMDAHVVNDLFFTGVRVLHDAVVGEVGNGWKQLMRGLSVERLIIAAMTLGSAQRALDDVIAFTTAREQFGRTVSSFQAVRHRIADMATEIAFCRSFVYDVAARVDAGEEDDLAKEGSMAKLKCSEVAKAATLEAMQLMGGYGYSREYGMEAQVRRALAPPIYGGTNEIQRDIIAKALGL
jgi:alkylation response protein AidB-like acyl-CoA dehydrogenase